MHPQPPDAWPEGAFDVILARIGVLVLVWAVAAAAGSATLGCMDPRPTVAALGALLAVGATACGASGNGAAVPMVAKLDVAYGVSDEVGAQRHTLAPVVDCPNDLPREVGASEQCSETDLTPGGRHAVSVRIDRIDGAGIHYSVVVGTAPLPPPGD